jgi:hypothetical protein
MKMFAKAKFICVIVSLCLSFYACQKESENKTTDFSKGVYISNEGGFQNNNGSISFYNPQNGDLVNYVFESANTQLKTGDIVQSFAVAGNKGIIVSNNENLIKIVALKNFSFIKALPVSYPRHCLLIDSTKAYLTQGAFSGKIMVLNLASLTFTDSINVGMGPENLIKDGNHVFVANSGGWSRDSTISVIDVTSKSEETINVKADSPTDVVLDATGNIWVLCMGYTDYNNDAKSTPSKLVKINGITHNIDASFILKGNSYSNPHRLAISPDKKTIYYTESDGVYAVSTGAASLSDSPFIAKSLYGLSVNPQNGDIYCFENTSFTTSGVMYIFNSNGTLKFTGVVGIGPNGAVFNL